MITHSLHCLQLANWQLCCPHLLVTTAIFNIVFVCLCQLIGINAYSIFSLRLECVYQIEFPSIHDKWWNMMSMGSFGDTQNKKHLNLNNGSINLASFIVYCCLSFSVVITLVIPIIISIRQHTHLAYIKKCFKVILHKNLQVSKSKEPIFHSNLPDWSWCAHLVPPLWNVNVSCVRN